MKKIILISTLIFICKELLSQSKRYLEVADLFNSYNIVDAKFSPDNKYAAIVMERPRKDQVIYGTNFINRYDIWLLDVQSNKIQILFDGKRDSCSYWNPVWSPDSKKIAFISTKGQDNIRAFVYNHYTNQITKVHSNGVNLMNKTFVGANGLNDPFLWLDADNLVVPLLAANQSHFTFSMNALSLNAANDDWVKMKYGIKHTTSGLDTDSLHLFPDDKNAYLIKYNLLNNEIFILDTGYFRHVIPSSDRTKLLVVKRSGGIPLHEIKLLQSPWNYNHRAGIIDLKNIHKFNIPDEKLNAPVNLSESPYIWSEKDNIVFIKGSNNRALGYWNTRNHQYTAFPEPLKYNLIPNKENWLLSSEGKSFSIDPASGKLKEMPITGAAINTHKEPSGLGTLLSKSNDSKYALYTNKDSAGLHLVLQTGTGTQAIQSFNTWISQVKDTKRELIEFTDGYGTKQKALLLFPNTERLKNKLVVSCYPGQRVRSIHYSGNSETTLSSDMYLNLLILASHGYHVLIPTMVTSGTDDYFEFQKSVPLAVNEARKVLGNENMDTHLMGLSYGGYSVYSLLTQTNQFKSGIVLAGFGDLISSYGNFDIRYRYSENPFDNVQRLRNPESGQGGLGIPYHSNPLKYLRNSPVFYVDKIQTPVLIIHGDRDFISIEQAEQMFTTLYRQGKKARFLRLWGEGHNIDSPENIKAVWAEILAWLK